MRRREFLGVLGGATAAWPLWARAQQQSMPVIGFVVDSTIQKYPRSLAGIRKGLAEHGYVEGQNFRFEFREANLQFGLFPILFRELADQKVTLLLVGTTSFRRLRRLQLSDSSRRPHTAKLHKPAPKPDKG